jgi:predicted transcriptional regulator
MQRAKSKPTAADDWAHELQALLVKKEIRPPGEGWLCSAEVSAKLKISRCQARKSLRRGLEEGVLEKFEGTKNHGARSYHYVWYRKKKRT